MLFIQTHFVKKVLGFCIVFFISAHAYALTDLLRSQIARAPFCFFVYLLPNQLDQSQTAFTSALTIDQKKHQLMLSGFDSASEYQIWMIRPSEYRKSATISPLIDAHMFLTEDHGALSLDGMRSDAPFFPNWLFTLFVSRDISYAGLQQYDTHHFMESDEQGHLLIEKDRQQLRGWRILDAATGKSCVSLLSSRYPEQPIDMTKECQSVELQTPSGQVLQCASDEVVMSDMPDHLTTDHMMTPRLGASGLSSIFEVSTSIGQRGNLLASFYNPYVHGALTIFQHPDHSRIQCVPVSSSIAQLPFMFILASSRTATGMTIYTRYGDPLAYDDERQQVWIDNQSLGQQWIIKAYPSGDDCTHYFHQLVTERQVTGYLSPLLFPLALHMSSTTSIYNTRKTRFFFRPAADKKNLLILTFHQEDLRKPGGNKVLRLSTGECLVPRVGRYDNDANSILKVGSCDQEEAHHWSYGSIDSHQPEQMQFCLDDFLSSHQLPMCLGISHSAALFLVPKRDAHQRLNPASLMVLSLTNHSTSIAPVFLTLEGQCLGVSTKKTGALLERFPCGSKKYDQRFYQVLPFQEALSPVGNADNSNLFMLVMYDWHMRSSGAWDHQDYCLGVVDHLPQLMSCQNVGGLLWHRQKGQLCWDASCIQADDFALPSLHMSPQEVDGDFSREVGLPILHTVSDRVLFRVRNKEKRSCMRAPILLGDPFFMATCYPHLSSYDDLYELFSFDQIAGIGMMKTGNGKRMLTWGQHLETGAVAVLSSVSQAKRTDTFAIFFDQTGRLYLKDHELAVTEKPVFAVEEKHRRDREKQPSSTMHDVLVEQRGQLAHWSLVPYLADQYVFQ